MGYHRNLMIKHDFYLFKGNPAVLCFDLAMRAPFSSYKAFLQLYPPQWGEESAESIGMPTKSHALSFRPCTRYMKSWDSCPKSL